MRRDSRHSHAYKSTILLLFLSLPLLGGCGEICCGIASVAVVIPLLWALERRFRGAAFLIVGLAVLALPLALWSEAEGSFFERIGVALALGTASLGHDLVAALLPGRDPAMRLVVGALLSGGWLGASAGLFFGMRRAGRPAAGLLLGVGYATLGLGLLQQGPSMRQFAPGGLDWPALSAPRRAQPVVPLRPEFRQVQAGSLRFLALSPYPTLRVPGQRVARGDCAVALRGPLFAGPPVSAGLWRQLTGEAAPGCDTGCPSGAPVQGARWLEAVELANRASSAWGLTPVYTVTGQKVTWNLNASGLRLPTEAEWELLVARGQAGDAPEWTWDQSAEPSCGEDPAFSAEKNGKVTLTAPKGRVARGGPAQGKPSELAGFRLVR